MALLAVCVWRSPAFRQMISPRAVAAYAPVQSYPGTLAPEDQSLWQQGTRLVEELARGAVTGELPEGQVLGPKAGDLPDEMGPLNGPVPGAGPHHHGLAGDAQRQAAVPDLGKPDPKAPEGIPEAAPRPEEPGTLPGPEGEDLPQGPKEVPQPLTDQETPVPPAPFAGEKCPEEPVHCGPLETEHRAHCHH